MSKGYFVVTGFIFAIIAIVHAMRLVYRWHVEIDAWVIPQWLSVLGVLLPGALALWAFRELRRE